jgi:APA family basic amino acid/polyamine antiporter
MTLSLFDLTFAGYGAIIGVAIFSLLPYIIKYSGGRVWLAFLIGGIISMFTGLSYARLSLDNAVNGAEYSWILDALTVEETDETSKRRNKYVKWFGAIIIWAIIILGLTMNSTILVGAIRFMNLYKNNVADYIKGFVLVAIPTAVNLFGVGAMAKLNIFITSLISIGLLMLTGIAGKNHKYIGDLALRGGGGSGGISGFMKAVFLTILPFNGFQTIAQLSDVATNKVDVPKGIIGSISAATIVYTIVAASTVAIIGSKTAGSVVSPISNAYASVFGSYGSDIVNILAIGNALPTMLIILYSRASILQSIAKQNIAPKICENINFSLVAVGIISYLFTFAPGDSLEVLAVVTNILTVFVFGVVNGLVLYKYHNNIWSMPIKQKEDTPMVAKFKKIYPFYAVIGLIIALILMSQLHSL